MNGGRTKKKFCAIIVSRLVFLLPWVCATNMNGDAANFFSRGAGIDGVASIAPENISKTNGVPEEEIVGTHCYNNLSIASINLTYIQQGDDILPDMINPERLPVDPALIPGNEPRKVCDFGGGRVIDLFGHFNATDRTQNSIVISAQGHFIQGMYFSWKRSIDVIFGKPSIYEICEDWLFSKDRPCYGPRVLGQPLISAPAVSPSPSFDCTKSKSTTERFICRHAAVAVADRKLSQVYKVALALSKKPKEFHSILSSERIWIIERDRHCTIPDERKSDKNEEEILHIKQCLLQFYDKRLGDIRLLILKRRKSPLLPPELR